MNFKFFTEKCNQMFTIGGIFPAFTKNLERTNDSFYFEENGVKVESEFQDSPEGIILRRDKITNVSDSTISLASLFSKFTFEGGEWEAYTQYSEWCGESDGMWQPINTSVSSRSMQVRNNEPAAPFLAIFNKQNNRGFAFHIICDNIWEIRTTKTTEPRMLTVEIGMSIDRLIYDIKPGETVELPAILYYEFKNKTDLEAYRLHRYCNRLSPAESLPIIYDSWLGCFDDIAYDKLSSQLDIAAKLGAEYYVIDAGWFGAARKWHSSVGDWDESPESSINMRMLEFSEEVRKKGLKFGLWFEIERAAKYSRAPQENPEYYIYEGGNYFVDFANPDAVKYIFGVLSKNITKYGIKFIKFDFNAIISVDPKNKAFHDYMKGYNDFLKMIEDKHPDVYLENCASGGKRMSLASLRGFDSFWMSDNHSLYKQLEIFKNTILRMPSRTLEKWITIRSVENFGPVYEGGVTEKILVSGDAMWGHIEAIRECFLKAVIKGGPIGFTCDLTTFSEHLVELLSEEIKNYKAERDFWMRTECHILADTDTMLVLQFNDIDYSKIKIVSFSKLAKQESITVYPFCDKECTFIGQDGKEYTDKTLDTDGITLPVKDRFTACEFAFERK